MICNFIDLLISIIRVYNKGTIPAYLTGITFGKKTCRGVSGTSDELVQVACGDIAIQVYSHAVGATYSSSGGQTVEINQSERLDPNETQPITLLILGYQRGHVVDGDFTATIDNVTFTYSSQQTPT